MSAPSTSSDYKTRSSPPGPASSPRGISYKRPPTGHAGIDYLEAKARSGSSSSLSSLPHTSSSKTGTSSPRSHGSPRANGFARTASSPRASGSRINGSTPSPRDDVFGGSGGVSPRGDGSSVMSGSGARSRRAVGLGVSSPPGKPGEQRRVSEVGVIHKPKGSTGNRRASEASSPGNSPRLQSLNGSTRPKRPGQSRRVVSTGTNSPTKPFPDSPSSQSSIPPSPSKNLSPRSPISLSRNPSGLAISISQPTPERAQAGPSRLPLRRKSSESDLVAAAKNIRTTSPSGILSRPGSQRTSYHLSHSVSSRSSASMTSLQRESSDHPDNGDVSTLSGLGKSQEGSNFAANVVDLGSSGSDLALDQEPSRTPEVSSIEAAQNGQLRQIEIPPRTSSNSPKANAIQPQISPRKSSMSGLLPDPPEVPSSDKSQRRASRNVNLGDIYETSRSDHSPRKASPAGSPSPARRQSEFKSASPALGKKPSPYSSPRPERKTPNPNLTIAPPVMTASRSVSSSARPSPPIPTKSPLRGLSRHSSAVLELKNIRPPNMRADSNDSSKATAGWLTPPEGRPGLEETLQRPRPDTIKDLPDIPTPTTAEIRFTMLTTPSIYSQDSAPPSSASTVLDSAMLSAVPSMYSDDSAVRQRVSWHGKESTTMLPENEGLHDPINANKRNSRMGNIGWGRKKSQDTASTLSPRSPQPPQFSPRSPQPPQFNKTLPVPSFQDDSRPVTPSSSEAHLHPEGKPMRSPSMPNMSPATPNKAARLLGIDRSPAVSGGMARNVTEPSPLLPPVLARSPTTPNMLTRSPTGVSSMSKRVHLIREIANTERAYANDLALVRDAFLPRQSRRASQHSLSESVTSPGITSDVSRRSSTYTYQTAETKRSSGIETGSSWTIGGTTPITPYKEGNVDGYFSQLNTPTMSPSMSVSPRQSTVSLVANVTPRGKALSSADVKAVFLNLSDLAALAEELACAFEEALGDDSSPQDGMSGDGGNDRLGEAFVDMIPRLRPLYLVYCARQAVASARLRELQSDPGHKQYLLDCWSLVKPHTHAWNLDSMLIKPVQRITKYPLLFDDLLANTTPVHPDYFSIRTAAERSREMAMELDEAKRRKDIVAGVINKRPVAPIQAKESKPKGLKLFRKEKTNGSTPSLAMSISSSELGSPPDIPASSHLQLKELTVRVEEAEQVVRRIGKEIVLWVAVAKDIFTVEDAMTRTWLRVVQLESTDQADQRLAGFRKVMAEIVASAWAPLNEEVKDRILPVFARLLDVSTNPNKVIAKRAAKLSDYARYIQLRDNRRPIDRTLLSSASDFYALHSQLVDELPAFLEGHSRILDIALVAFARAQARYHQAVRDKLDEFVRTWITTSRRSSMSPSAGDEEVDATSGRGIVKAWHDAWAPYAEAMDHFQSTRPGRNVTDRITSFTAQPGSRDSSRTVSPAPQLRHTPSFRSSTLRPASPSAGRPEQRRQRSTSLLSQGPSTMAPIRDSRFGLFRQHSRTSVKDKDREKTTGQMLPPPTPSQSLRPAISSPMNSANRHSFGLPRIPTDTSRPIFEGLGLSPHKSTVAIRAASDPSAAISSPQIQPSVHPFADFNPSRSHIVEDNLGLGLGNIEAATPPLREVDDAAEGWRNEKVLYQCACVADFDPAVYGSKKYRGLRFLRITTGDLVDVFHEVGRIDELPRFPYPEVGVDNDGALVGRAENGDIGLVICSFLEPLRE
ncbi:hypothetical protein BCR39DRAFT_589529 [Naematelia encephala]|uniref:DH domain-containing protein n=1 Tax=Naematelia encephala TaxID=71784 RepID=A0A1Y2AWE9_9TREE|nr:hypothetical protein BCR39DRAFT_589529 [Naematelia encephala]